MFDFNSEIEAEKFKNDLFRFVSYIKYSNTHNFPVTSDGNGFNIGASGKSFLPSPTDED